MHTTMKYKPLIAMFVCIIVALKVNATQSRTYAQDDIPPYFMTENSYGVETISILDSYLRTQRIMAPHTSLTA